MCSLLATSGCVASPLLSLSFFLCSVYLFTAERAGHTRQGREGVERTPTRPDSGRVFLCLQERPPPSSEIRHVFVGRNSRSKPRPELHPLFDLFWPFALLLPRPSLALFLLKQIRTSEDIEKGPRRGACKEGRDDRVITNTIITPCGRNTGQQRRRHDSIRARGGGNQHQEKLICCFLEVFFVSIVKGPGHFYTGYFSRIAETVSASPLTEETFYSREREREKSRKD